MNGWNLFTWFFQSFDVPFLVAVNTLSANLSSSLIPLTTVLATIYIALTAYGDLYLGNGGGNPVLDLVRRCARVVLVLACLDAANYTGTISNLLLTDLPNGLAQAVTGAATVGAGSFDSLGGQAWATCVQIWNNLSISPKSIVLGLYAGLYLLDAGLAIAISFTIWLVTQVGLGLVVAIGPLAIACLIMPQTVRFFNGWLACVVTGIVAQLLIVVTISILVTTINITLGQIVGQNAATGANANDIGAQIHQLTNAGLMFTISGIVCLSIMPIARAIGGGAATELNGITRWAAGGIGSGTSAAAHPVATAQAAQAGLSKAGDAGMRSIKAVGRAL